SERLPQLGRARLPGQRHRLPRGLCGGRRGLLNGTHALHGRAKFSMAHASRRNILGEIDFAYFLATPIGHELHDFSLVLQLLPSASVRRLPPRTVGEYDQLVRSHLVLEPRVITADVINTADVRVGVL